MTEPGIDTLVKAWYYYKNLILLMMNDSPDDKQLERPAESTPDVIPEKLEGKELEAKMVILKRFQRYLATALDGVEAELDKLPDIQVLRKAIGFGRESLKELKGIGEKLARADKNFDIRKALHDINNLLSPLQGIGGLITHRKLQGTNFPEFIGSRLDGISQFITLIQNKPEGTKWQTVLKRRMIAEHATRRAAIKEWLQIYPESFWEDISKRLRRIAKNRPDWLDSLQEVQVAIVSIRQILYRGDLSDGSLTSLTEMIQETGERDIRKQIQKIYCLFAGLKTVVSRDVNNGTLDVVFHELNNKLIVLEYMDLYAEESKELEMLYKETKPFASSVGTMREVCTDGAYWNRAAVESRKIVSLELPRPGLKILVIDNEKAICGLLRSQVRSAGSVCATASSDEELQNISIDPNLIFLDNDLEKKWENDGLQYFGHKLLPYLRMRWPNAKIIVNSGDKPDSIRDNYPGVAGFNSKPDYAVANTLLKQFFPPKA